MEDEEPRTLSKESSQSSDRSVHPIVEEPREEIKSKQGID